VVGKKRRNYPKYGYYMLQHNTCARRTRPLPWPWISTPFFLPVVYRERDWRTSSGSSSISRTCL